jgi:putative ABC transport system permease protein
MGSAHANGIIVLGIDQIMLAYVFALVVLFIVMKRGIKREKEILVSSIRMTVQLVLTGYILTYVLENPNPWVTGLIILCMEAFAIGTIFKKFRCLISKGMKWTICVSMAGGTLTCLLYFLLIVVRISPWYDPQYFIPIAGMFVGNTMTAVSLGVKSLVEGMTTQKSLVEEALVLGATPREATATIINRTFDAAIMPTMNTMIGMGIVFLPGMMTGQILSGTAPTTAITYQLAVMLGILGSVALSVIIMLTGGYRSFFNDQDQLRS